MSKTNGRRRGYVRVLFALVVMLFAYQGWAQTAANPEDEYKKRVKVDEEMSPLGDNPFDSNKSMIKRHIYKPLGD
ncbi:hypothetical protein ACQKIE_06430 [Luteibacter sp. NPDC031894]|uniref:hypothetical protein n=1 Tax=Luteibacter sp. NPDC031894 TaxID=3390572 RepID=UPI003CFE0CB4